MSEATAVRTISSDTFQRVDNVVQDAQKRCRDVQEHLKNALSALSAVALNLDPSASSSSVQGHSVPFSKSKVQVLSVGRKSTAKFEGCGFSNLLFLSIHRLLMLRMISFFRAGSSMTFGEWPHLQAQTYLNWIHLLLSRL